MKLDSAGLEVLSRPECLELLGSVSIGRIVFTDRALPAVQPVNFVLDDETVVIRTTIGSKLAAAARDAIVAFEADDFDPSARTGWSVTAVGPARAVYESREIERLARLPLTAWAPASRDHYILVQTGHLTGRRISPRPVDRDAAAHD
ncbi:pyridoxamine 5'-phosphate oxidase family protein [Streptosporangium sp. NPDC049644]|uniref:pyridoxamine 5'-phosphate oxidase family protein n=1 Tax=Streptosporangium sp. NPDC049644 TaxID=3155507 RepID=UPI00344040C5